MGAGGRDVTVGSWIVGAKFTPEPFDRDADGPYYWVRWSWGSVQIAVWDGDFGEWMRPWGMDGDADDADNVVAVWSEPVTSPGEKAYSEQEGQP